jgi:phosphatidylglycerophosphate synthase
MNNINGISDLKLKTQTVKETLFQDRTRTNLFRKYEQSGLIWLVQRIPSWMTSDMLTGIGFTGAIIVFLGFVMAAYINIYFMLLGIAGFAINWFGDSLDGRLAYYRNKPRKHYGFTLDITIDWLGIILIGYGYIVYARGIWELLGYGFIVMYGWEMIIALMRYRLTGKYSIDSGVLGPTEVRIVISLILLTEVLIRNSIIYMSSLAVVIMFIVNIIDTTKLLKIANKMDIVDVSKTIHKEPV